MNKLTQTQRSVPTLMHTYTNTQHLPNMDTHRNKCSSHTHTPLDILYAPRSRHKHPRGATPDHGHGSLYAGVEKGKPPLVLQQQGSPPAQTQTSFSSQPSTPDGKQRTGCVKKGSPFLESAHPLTPMCDPFPDTHQGQWVPGPIQTEASSSTTKPHRA